MANRAAAKVSVAIRLVDQGRGGEVEQPGGDDAAAAPDFGDRGNVEVIRVVLGMSQRRGLGVGVPGWRPSARARPFPAESRVPIDRLT
jgi:hypothetical protein